MKKILATNSKGEGILPMRQSPEIEKGKSPERKNEELCNFIKNAFCASGQVKLVSSEIPLSGKVFFEVEDSKRGTFFVLIVNKI